MDHALTLGVGLAVLYPGEAIAGTAATLIAPGSWDVAWGLWGCALGAVAVGVALAASHRRGAALPRWLQWPVLIALLVGLAHVAPMSWGQASLAVAALLWVAGWGATAKGWSLAAALVPVGRVELPESVAKVVKPAVDEVAELMSRDVPVLILGERGSGKEYVTRRAAETLGFAHVEVVDCGSFADDPAMMRSEIFGYARGAHSMARADAPGAVDRAGACPMLLDEIGNLLRRAQAMLLRFTQTKTGQRVGDNRAARLVGPLVMATNADLRRLALDGQFLPDLYDRISHGIVELPPLRQWGEVAIIDLAEHVAAEVGAELCNGARRILRQHCWPGNVRELRGAIRTAAALGDGGRLNLDRLARSMAHALVEDESENDEGGDGFGPLPPVERLGELGALGEMEALRVCVAVMVHACDLLALPEFSVDDWQRVCRRSERQAYRDLGLASRLGLVAKVRRGRKVNYAIEPMAKEFAA